MKHPVAAGTAVLAFGAFMALYFWLGTQPDPKGVHHITNDFVGCQDRSTIEQMRKVAGEGDTRAAVRLANQQVDAGNCVRLFPGNAIYVEDITMSGLTKMRLQGQPTVYWTVSKFVGQ